jgi:hypothetical protein
VSIGNIDIPNALVPVVDDKSASRAVTNEISMMLLSRDPESIAVDERQIIEGSCVAGESVKTEPRLS